MIPKVLAYVLAVLCLSLSTAWGQQVVNKSQLRISLEQQVSVYRLAQGGALLQGAFVINEGERRRTEASFVDGRIEGVHREYLHGQLAKQGTYHSGRREGLWQEFFPGGVLSLERHYRSGRRHGSDISYYNNGQIERRRNYLDNLLEGKESVYSPSGVQTALYHWQEDQRHGKFWEWEELGEGKRCYKSGSYQRGKLHGDWSARFYDKQGKCYYAIYRYYSEGVLQNSQQGKWEDFVPLDSANRE